MKRFLIAFGTFGVCALLPAIGLAQAYPEVTPVARTTDAPILRKLALEREITERFRLGLEADARGDWKRERAEFERIITLHPKEPQGSTAYYDLGRSQVNLGALDDAVASFETAIGLDPAFLAARANLVAVQLMHNDLAAARTSADAFVARAPDSARALYSRGLIALRSGDAAVALQDFGNLLRREPTYAIAHYDLALAELKLNDLGSAQRELQTAIGLAPTFARAHFTLGTVLLRVGKRDRARDAFAAAERTSRDLTLRTLAASVRDSITH
ncbi:MAG: tetratricopeptide repeat protein [Candidatus Eremiobacteraeota bacterium]|nr:tetratricopeptide repeat protein [Candidatus Eremiobacteraeota bacterium]MBC5801460.1 tetratricopeptide repeat protein [Candidatus Eremiobacteraeota bacterium]MBC5820820.1 tetratricopeptide repeat protein [Candidatus Eremiobacteraeota bacterium]